MKIAIVSLAMVLLAAADASAASPEETLAAQAEACIRAAAPRTSGVSAGLTDAVNVLVDDLFGVEVHYAVAYEMSGQALKAWKETTASSQRVGVSIDPTTGELKTPPGFTVPFNTATIMASALRAGADNPLGTYRKFAAEAVLAAKLRQP